MNLTDTQNILLQAAAHHPEHLLTNFPATLKGGARLRVLKALVQASYIAPQGKAKDGATEFVMTPAGFEALGLQAPQQPTATAATPVRREGTKQAALIGLLSRPGGATLGQMVAATGWQSHTVRGTLAGAFKKRLGLTIISAKTVGAERTYRIA